MKNNHWPWSVPVAVFTVTVGLVFQGVFPWEVATVVAAALLVLNYTATTPHS